MRLGYRKIAVFGKLSWRKAGEILIYIYMYNKLNQHSPNYFSVKVERTNN